MIFFTDRNYKTLAIADSESDQGLKLINDELNQTIKTGTAIYTATIAKNDESASLIESGCFVFVPNFKGKIIVLEVMEVEESRSYKKIIAEDAGLELLNSDVGEHKMKGTLREHILATIGDDSDWVIGRDDIGDSHNLTLEYTGFANQTKRIAEIAGRFGAEVSYDFVFDGNRIKEKRINFHKQRGVETAIRLEVGKELSDVKRNVSITNLRTAVLGIGQPHKETVKTDKTVSKTVSNPEPTVNSNGKLDPFINWFKSRQGKVSYSMGARLGPNSYDCSSAVFFAAKNAGLIPSDHFIGSTETLFTMKGRYLDEISRGDIKYGDIFIAGKEGYSGGAGGHTGAVIDKNNIIHCSYSKNGIAITPIDGYTGGPPVRWFRWRNAGTTSKPKGKYWTDSDLTKHDLGWILSTLDAKALNNWIKATSPASPFNGQGNVFIEAQKQSGLDARYILAHAALESAWGTSNIAKKYNNYFGIMAYDTDPEMAKNFSNASLASGIINGAKWIAEHYYNSSYKQTTLYKMRFNGGVHEYATDPKWHTKIAGIMKASERYTSPSTTNDKIVIEIKHETQEVEKETNLIGYEYDDGRYFVDDRGRVCDREANAIRSKPNTKGKYLTRIYESEATSQKTLFDECLLQLKNNNEPEVTYEVSPDKIPNEIDVGDSVRIIDHDYSPALYLDARLVDVTTSSTSEYIEKAVFANFVPKESGIAESLLNLQNSVRDFKFEWGNLPYEMKIESTSGNIFKDDIVNTTLIGRLTKAGIDQSANVDGFIWERVSKYPDKLVVSDESWNEERSSQNEHFIELQRSDIELEADFVCSAMVDGTAVATASYNIKNFAIGIYKQENEPDRSLLKWGDIWQWDDGNGTYFKRIWKGDRWEDTVTKRDLELLELTPGPPGADGKDGMPGPAGADGKTSYFHFAYADNADGSVGFTLTATQGKKYIGFYTDFTEADSTVPSKYKWSKFVGEDGKDGIAGKDGVGIKSTVITYGLSSSDTSQPTSWTSSVPSLVKGQYLWTKTVWTYTDSTTETGYSKTYIAKDGNDGSNGIAGKDGVGIKSTSITYASSTSGTTPPSGTWTTSVPSVSPGYYLWTKTVWYYTDNTSETGYSVSKMGQDGSNGIPGSPGADGKTPYFHTAWANSTSGLNFSTSYAGEKKYFGTYVDFTEADSSDYRKYTWQLVKGEKGDKGDTGLPGKDGADGLKGADGVSQYIHFAYADNASGTSGFTTSFVAGKKYIGMYVDSIQSDSTSYLKYKWSKFVGEDGKDGIPGSPGADGKTPYFHTAWANNNTGSSGFSTVYANNRTYFGTYVDYNQSDSTDPSKYTWQLVKGSDGAKGDKGDTGPQGPAGADGKDGADGKTGKIGQNLLRKSNVTIEDSTNYVLNSYYLCETPSVGETMTLTLKIKLEKADNIGIFNSGNQITLSAFTSISQTSDYQIWSTTFPWKSSYSSYSEENPPFINVLIKSNSSSTIKNKVSVEWAVLSRGDIPAIEWSPCYADYDDAISDKASAESLQDLQVHFAIYPTAEELNQNRLDLAKQAEYLEQLKTAIDSTALSLEDRINIIEANVGAGKLSLEAINTYLNFGEEGVLIGKDGDQIRLRLINNALEITDGSKVVARFANNQTETPNLKVSGAFEFGYHVANKVDLGGNKYTVISANI